MKEKLTVEVEALLAAHIARLETSVAGRDSDNPWHQSLNKVDSKNIASLREGRIPIYGDHMEMDNDVTMFEFDDVVKEQRLTTLKAGISAATLPYDGSPYGEGLSGPYTPYPAT